LPTGAPQALARRVTFFMILAATLIGTMVSAPATRAQTPPTEGRIRLTPAMSDVPGTAGPFTVYVVAEDLQHDGSITYDDNRDTTPDRSVPSEGLGAFQITVTYDPAVLAVDSVVPGPEMGRTGRSFQCLGPVRQPGSVSFGCLSAGDAPAGTQGTLTLASITLVPQEPGISQLSLDAVLAGPLGDSIDVAVNGGAARVTGTVPATTAPPEPSGIPNNAPSSTLTPGSQSTRETAAPQTPTLATAARPTTPRGGSPTSQGHPTPPDSPGGRSFGGAALWSVVIAGSVGASGLLGLAAMVWRQRQHRRGT
jgi:hypothetical protein